VQLEQLTVRLGEGPNRTLFVRPNTSDRAVVADVLEKRAYDLRRLDRTQGQQRYADILGMLDRRRQRTGKRPLILDAGANIGVSALSFIADFPSRGRGD
jgi:hypothetical protein